MLRNFENFLGLGLILWNEMGREFSTDRGRRGAYRVLVGNLAERDY